MSRFLLWLRQHILHCLSALAVLLGGTATVHTFGMSSGFVATGVQEIITAAGPVVRYENVQSTAAVATAANLSAPLPSLTIPVPLTQGNVGVAWLGALANCDGLDAGNCDAGVCTGLLEQKFALDLHGGQCCVVGGSFCTGTDAAVPTSYALINTDLAPLDAAAPAYGVSMQVSCFGSSGLITATAYAGPNQGCTFYGVTSEWQNP